ncbi:MAG: exosortase [Edaphobacter sp.]|uniref:exosortase n=1 Tax=Edaphobacter sp. TaxID=1934404 RepID=UPI002399B809|nr:exosortase [Edaphobacter sp.]MDE1178112.1 exosortase [Edaphobacter sp.]
MDHNANVSYMMASSTQAVPAAGKMDAGSRETLPGLLSRVPKGAWVPLGIVSLLLVALYLRVGIKLVVDWYNIADYSHGFLVPLFSLFLLWDKRREIAATPVKGSWAGLPLVVLGLVILIFGIYGVDLFTSRFSFVVLISGLVWTFFGGAMLKELRFPILVLLLAIPFPAIIFNQITFPLQLMASQVASSILPLLGVPTLQEGNVIQLPVMKLEVAEACSGIRSLMSLFTLAIFYGYFLEKTTARRTLLAIAAIPIAVTANVFRIVGTGLCVQYWDPNKAQGFFHEFSGWVMFLVSLGCLYLVHKVIGLFSPAPKEAV